MKKLVQLLLLMTLPLVVMASELKEGTLSVLLFSEGKPLANNEIKIDGKKVFKTDEDGAVKISLVAGRHQIEIFGKNAAGENLGYFKKPVGIKEGRDTEIIATLSKSGADSIDIDVPVAVAASVEREAEKATGEGRLSGQVLSSEGNMPIAGARVFVRGTAVDIRTDESGRFSAKVPSGKTLSISVVHSAYSAQTLGGIVVKKDGTASRTVKLTPASMELEEFVVLAPKIEGSIADVVAEEKNINAVASILGSEEMAKKGDSDAANALKRVTGLTLVDGSSIFVRGLGERYSNIEMNGMPLPSPNPLKRVVPLDIFPASVIGSMKVQKSATADIPASFGGGYIDIRTKDTINDDYIKISLGGSGNSNTGLEVLTYKGSDTDFLGYDDGYRDIPQSILDLGTIKVGETLTNFATLPEDQLIAMGKEWAQREYNTYFEALPLGMSGSIEAAKKFSIDDHEISVFATYGYSQDHKYKAEAFYGYDYDQATDKLKTNPSRYGTNFLTTSEYSHGGMFNVNYDYYDVLNLKYTKLYTHNAEKNTRLSEGLYGSNYDVQRKYFLDWEERTLDVDQFVGNVDYSIFDLKNNAEFGLELGTATLNQPNNYKYTYLYENNLLFLTDNFNNSIANRLNSEDEITAFFLHNKTMLEMFSKEDYIDLGITASTKDRTSRQEKFYLRSTKTVDETTLTGNIDSIYDQYITNSDILNFAVSSLFTSADYFDANLDETNYYFNIFTKPFDPLELMFGLRYVDLIQSVNQYGLENDDSTLPIVLTEESLDINDIFPSFNLKYKISDKHQIDAAMSRTYIMPDFREFTSGTYYHPYEVADIKGNPNLVYTDIYNLDLKYSYFFSDVDNLQFGLFYKYLDNPIEDILIPSSSLEIYSFDNSDYAHLYGFEVAGRKSLDFFSPYISNDMQKYIGAPKNYYFAGNFSYTESIVYLREDQLATFTTNERQLQGLSPYVVNLTFGYDNEKRNMALSYNKMDTRLRKVGLVDGPERYPDYYEIPPHLLDFVWQERFDSGLSAKLIVGNILDDPIIWTQGGQMIKAFTTGQTVNFSASYQF